MTINSVWSAHGHRFMSTDTEGHESCLTCGAMYQLVPTPDASHDGEYLAADGSEPMECTHDTNMAHGYPGERDDSHSATVEHDCNCLFCA
jgi:hypothetical protein